MEIEQHGLAKVGQQDVAGLDVEMQHSLFVGVRQALGQPGPQPQHGGRVILAPQPKDPRLRQLTREFGRVFGQWPGTDRSRLARRLGNGGARKLRQRGDEAGLVAGKPGVLTEMVDPLLQDARAQVGHADHVQGAAAME